MNRRTFIKRIGQAVAGVLALPFMSKSKAENDVVTTNGTDEIQEWVSPTFGMMDFSPDSITGMGFTEDRLIVFCKHSVWEIFRDYTGEWRRKQLSCLGSRVGRIRESDVGIWEHGVYDGVRFIERDEWE